MALPPGFLDELRSRVPLTRIVGRKVTWDSRKSNAAKGDWWAPCPFHQEKSASFHVDDVKGYYYCFGCQAKGDAVSFLRETENLGFMEAVERLAGEAGMPMPDRDPAAAARAAALTGLVEVMEAALRFYRAQLSGAAASEARAYLERRGVAQASREQFELGFASPARTLLLDHLRAKGVALPLMAEAGLVVVPEDGGAPYDRFRDRILFPIRDGRGRAIAFGGRAMSPDARAKYLNSPETPLFDKGRTLYNIAPARAAAGRTGALVVVEGYMDVIALVQAGIAHAVAPLGTAITADQLQLLWTLAPEPVVALDGDAAGQNAARRLVDLALPLIAAGKGLRFALMPPGQDPDDVVRNGGRAAFGALLDASRPMIDLIWERETEGAPLDSPERRAALDARLRARLARIADPSIRAHYEAELRGRRADLFGGRRRQRQPFQRGIRPMRASLPPAPSLATTRASLLAQAGGIDTEARIRESAILTGCLNHPGLVARFEDRLERAEFRCSDLRAIRDALLAAAGAEAADLAAAITARLGVDPRAPLAAVGQVAANPHLRPGADPEAAARVIEEELARLAARSGRLAEVQDAALGLTAETADSFAWRLRQIADAAHSADRNPLNESKNDSDDESSLSLALQNLIDDQIWKKPPKR